MSSLKRKRDDGYGYDDGYDDEYRDKTIAKLRLEVEELKSRLESIYCCGCLHEITVCDGCQKSYCYRCLRETTQTNDGVEETVEFPLPMGLGDRAMAEVRAARTSRS